MRYAAEDKTSTIGGPEGLYLAAREAGDPALIEVARRAMFRGAATHAPAARGTDLTGTMRAMSAECKALIAACKKAKRGRAGATMAGDLAVIGNTLAYSGTRAKPARPKKRRQTWGTDEPKHYTCF